MPESGERKTHSLDVRKWLGKALQVAVRELVEAPGPLQSNRLQKFPNTEYGYPEMCTQLP
jgi:hypothetical protein